MTVNPSYRHLQNANWQQAGQQVLPVRNIASYQASQTSSLGAGTLSFRTSGNDSSTTGGAHHRTPTTVTGIGDMIRKTSLEGAPAELGEGQLSVVQSLAASGEIPVQRNFAFESRLSSFDAQFAREHIDKTEASQIESTKILSALTRLSGVLQRCPLHPAHNELGVF